MRFALLGVDSESLAVAEAALELGHALVWPPRWAGGNLPRSLPVSQGDEAAETEDWEMLLDTLAIDAVVMGTGQADLDLRARQLNELMRQEQCVLTVHPLFDQLLTYFEIDMTRSETGALLCRFNPLTTHVLATRLGRITADASHEASEGVDGQRLGPVEQLVATRYTSDRGAEQVTRHFARDVELLEQLAGRLDRVGAHGAIGPNAYAGLSVQLLGRGGCPVRWSVAPPASGAALEVALICQHGRATLTLDDSGRLLSAWRLVGDRRAELEVEEQEPAQQAAAQFFALVESRKAKGPERVRDEASTWEAALHAMELADSIELSLRRGRMIDVHEQQLTEELAFKGTMAAAGCGLMVVIGPLILAIGWLAGLLGIPVARYWPHVMLGLFAVFLALQVVPRLLFRSPGYKAAAKP